LPLARSCKDKLIRAINDALIAIAKEMPDSSKWMGCATLAIERTLTRRRNVVWRKHSLAR